MRFLILASVALNVAFAGVWLAHAIPATIPAPGAPQDVSAPGTEEEEIWCPLHRMLKVSDAQWQRIEPRLKEFRAAAEAACARVQSLRLEMLDLIEGPEPDAEAIAAKQDQILAGQRQVQSLVIRQLLAEKEVLTSDQEAELFALIRARSGCNRSGPLMMSGPGRGGMGRVLRGGGKDE